MDVKLTAQTAKSLYERLLRPERIEETTVYTVSLTLARELREEISKGLEGAKDEKCEK